MISTCSRLRSHLKFCGIKLGTTERRIQRSRSTKCQKRHETTCFRSFQGLLIGSDGWFMASKMNGSVLRKCDSSQTSKSSPSFCQRLVASQLERLTKPIVGLEGGCSWPIWKDPGAASGMWEPSGNHLGTIWEPSGKGRKKISAPLSSCMQHLFIAGEKKAMMPCGIDGICQVRWRLPFGH